MRFHPIAGSGSTLLAAKRLGRRFVGFEIDAAMAEKARHRMSMGESSMNLTRARGS